MKQKLLFFAILMMAMAIPQSVKAYDFSAVCSTGQTLYYNISGSNVSVTSQNSSYPRYSTYPTGNLVIPSSVTYSGTTYSVTSIGNCAFYECSGLTSVTIPNTVTSIGYYSFSGCNNLTSVTIPGTVDSIGHHAFLYCTSLASVSLSEGLQLIDSSAFAECFNLISINIPSTVNEIRSWAFYLDSTLTSISIPAGITYLAEGLFNRCFSLTSVSLPNTLTRLDSGPFWGCSSLTNIDIPASVTEIGQWSFGSCTSLASVSLHDGLQVVGNNAFNYCPSLTSITLPGTLDSIGDDAFIYSGLSNNGTITMLAEVPPTITSNTFNGIPSTTYIVVPCGATESYYAALYWNSFSNIIEEPSCSDTHAITLATNGGYIYDYTEFPYIRTYSMLSTQSNVTGDTVLTGETGSSLALQIYSLDPLSCVDYNIDGSVCKLTAIYIDGVPIDLSSASSNSAYSIEISDMYYYYGGIRVYYLTVNYNSNHTVNVVFGPYFDGNTCMCFQQYKISNITNSTADLSWLAGSGPVYSINYGTYDNFDTENGVFNGTANSTTITSHDTLIGYHLTDLQPSTHYVARVQMECEDGWTYWWWLEFWTGGDPHCISVTNNGGHVSFVMNNETSHRYSDESLNGQDSTIVFNSHEGFSLTLYLTTMTPETAEMSNIAPDACRLRHLYIDNVEVPLSSRSNNNYTLTVRRNGNIIQYTLEINFNAAHTVDAVFGPYDNNTFVVRATGNDPTMGSATVNGSATAIVTRGETVTLSANANAGYHFVRWNDNNTDSIRTVTVTEDISYTAYFEANGGTEGITDVDGRNVQIYAEGGNIVVNGVENEKVQVFNMVGRQVGTQGLPTGVYMVKVGILPARKVVVMR